MDNTTNENNEIKNDNIVSEKNESKKDSYNILKATCLVAGGVLLGSLATIVFNGENNVATKVEISKDGVASVKKSVFKGYPKEITDFSKFSKELTDKEADIINEKEGSYIRYIGDKGNGNSLYQIGLNIFELDEYFNKINKFNIDSLSSSGPKDSFTFLHDVNKTSDGVLAQYIIRGIHETHSLIVKFDDNGNVKEKKTTKLAAELSYDKELDEVVLADTSNGKLNIIRCDSDLNALFSHEFNIKDEDDFSFVSRNGLTAVFVIHDNGDDECTSEIITLDKEGKEIYSNKIQGRIGYASIDSDNKVYLTVYKDNAFRNSKCEILTISGDKTVNTKVDNVIKGINSIDKVKDGYIVVSYNEYNNEIKDNFFASTLLNVTKYSNNGEVIWEHNFGVLNNTEKSSYDAIFNSQVYIENDEVIIKGFVNQAPEDSDEEDIYKLYMKIDTEGKVKSLL